MRYFVLTFIGIWLLLFRVAGAQDITFFSEIPDVPVMSNFIELPDNGFTFEKPEGRVVEAVAIGSRAITKDIVSYYTTSLPQFGWHPKDEFNFMREHEHLKLTIEHDHLQTSIHFVLSPQ
jgi:hypothetical protein